MHTNHTQRTTSQVCLRPTLIPNYGCSPFENTQVIQKGYICSLFCFSIFIFYDFIIIFVFFITFIIYFWLLYIFFYDRVLALYFRVFMYWVCFRDTVGSNGIGDVWGDVCLWWCILRWYMSVVMYVCDGVCLRWYMFVVVYFYGVCLCWCMFMVMYSW